MTTRTIQVLAISGSLREKSSNTSLMQAAIALAGADMRFETYRGLGELPHFNQDLDVEPGPASVATLRQKLQEADAVLICTPEFGNGVPGSLKNALDWIVSSGEFVNKPTAVISASPTPMGGDKAHASLLLTLGMINAIVPEGAKLIIPHISLKLDKAGNIVDEGLKRDLASVLLALREACGHS